MNLGEKAFAGGSVQCGVQVNAPYLGGALETVKVQAKDPTRNQHVRGNPLEAGGKGFPKKNSNAA